MNDKSSFLTTPMAILLGSILISIAILLHGGVIKLGGIVQPSPAPVAQPNQPVQPTPQGKVNVSAGHLPVKGNDKAKITIVEFSDFQCPFCEKFFTDAEANIIKDYVNTGKVKFYYRQLPLTSIHPNAYKAASAAECANEQGKFWEYHDILFQKQSSWASLDNTNAVNQFKTFSQNLGLDTTSFNSCLDSDKYKDKIDADMNDGQKAGINGTPATFVNGTLVSGAQPYANFKSLIDAELAK